MSMFSSASNAVCAFFNVITDVGEATGKTVGMATTYVDNRATAQKLTDKQSVMLDTAKTMRVIQSELQADEDLAKIFADLENEFN